jgi:hypothetical protein
LCQNRLLLQILHDFGDDIVIDRVRLHRARLALHMHDANMAIHLDAHPDHVV